MFKTDFSSVFVNRKKFIISLKKTFFDPLPSELLRNTARKKTQAFAELILLLLQEKMSDTYLVSPDFKNITPDFSPGFLEKIS